MKALVTLLRKAARAFDGAEGGPPEDGGFEDWLIVRASSASRLNFSTAAAGAYAHTAFGGHGQGPVSVERLLGLRRPPICGRVKLENVVGRM